MSSGQTGRLHDLRDRTVVVTGAASGIGRALATRFANAGMNVVLADVEPDALEHVAKELKTSTGDVLPVITDVSDPDSVDALQARATAAFGPVHVLCNNAGVSGGGPISTLSTADWSWVLGVNLWGVIHGLRAFLPDMLAHGEPGHIVNTASILGHGSGPMIAPYAATKFAVVAISESLHHELMAAGGRIGVSVLCPGMVNTRIFESDRNRPDGPTTTEPAGATSALSGLLAGAGAAPDDVAALVHDAIVERRFYVFTHPALLAEVERRSRAILTSGDPPEMLTALFQTPPASRI